MDPGEDSNLDSRALDVKLDDRHDTEFNNLLTLI